MEGVRKDERKENQGDRSFIQRDVYTQYCRYTEVVRNCEPALKRKLLLK
ncbi:hypothetical protein ES705_23718 [subsurface metagenome]